MLFKKKKYIGTPKSSFPGFVCAEAEALPGLLLLSCVSYLFSFAQFNRSYSLAQGQLVNGSVKSDSPRCQRRKVSSSGGGIRVCYSPAW